MRKSSLRSRLILGFSLVTIPLFILLISGNWYAVNVVQKQVATSNKNLVMMNMYQIDQKLTEAEKYLLKTSLQDPAVLSLGSYPEASDDAVYAKVNTFLRLSQDIPYYSDMTAFFGYRASSADLIFAAQQSMAYDTKENVRAKLYSVLSDSDLRQSFMRQWAVVQLEDEYALLRIVQSDEGTYIGVWVDLSRFLKPFHSLDMGEKGRILIASSNGTVLAHDTQLLADGVPSQGIQTALTDNDKSYHLVRFGSDGSEGMLVSQRSELADIHLAVLLPVRSLLEQLPLFQWFSYLTPAIAFIILLMFLFYLHRSFTLPVHRLLKGMRHMRSGNFKVRLEPSLLIEFNDINETFNQMSDEIETLKIDIYEEQLKTQKAELKHLQAQIHPHFYTNCLNIIYNLAQIKNMALVQKLSLLLVQHLRFTIRTNVVSVPLQDELSHIRNYLSIQELRFPNSFEYKIEAVEEAQHIAIPPLTIQPFVENAMEHGFCYKDDEPFRIEIRMQIERNAEFEYLVIHIEDNGMGFDSHILDKLQSGEYFRNEFDQHIGIWNVHHRCKLYYHAETLILFTNNESGGATVTLKLPLRE
jgi:two-component system sensor histidine kinase YesM